MKLFGFPPSPNTFKIQVVAYHIDVPLELELVDLTKGQQRTPQFLKLNPNGKTPVLVDDDFVLWESNAIMQYVASKRKNSLWPDDARTRADIGRWQFWQLAHWQEGCSGFLFENLIKGILNMGAPDAAALKTASEAFHRDAAMLDAHVADRAYLVGDSLTLADLSIGSFLFYAGTAKFPWEKYKSIQSWFARIEALPAWQKATPAV